MNGLSLLVYLSLFAQATAPLGSSAQTNANAPLGSAANFNSGLGTSAGVGTTPLGSSFSDSSKDETRTYGWQINEFNELEYIVQVSPSQIEFMQNPSNRVEFESTIPPALIGRVKRVIVKIGTEILPRTPLEEIDKLIPAIAKLPPGTMRDMENGSVVNVNNPGNGVPQYSGQAGFNATPAPLGSTFTDQARGNSASAQPQGSLLDRISQSGAPISGQGSSRFGNSAQGVGALSSGSNRLADTRGSFSSTPSNYVPDLTGQRLTDPAALGTNGYAGNGYPSNGYGGTAALGNGGLGTGNNGAIGNGLNGYGTNGNGTTPYANNGYGTTGGLNANGYGTGGYVGNQGGNQYSQGAPYLNNANSYNSNLGNGPLLNGANNAGAGSRFGNSLTGYAGDPNYSQSQSYNQGYVQNQNGQYPNRQPGYGSTTGYGDNYGGFGGPLVDPRKAGATYADSSMAPAIGYLASTNAAPRTDLPSTTNSASRTTVLPQRSDLQTGSFPHYQSADGNYFFYVFFILSIAVNLWLVHLLRSLYLRYRNLLSSLRSQATSLG